jgi:HlyD family secretion protein
MKVTRARLIVAGAGLAVLAGIGALFRPKPITVDTVVVTRGPLESTIEADGRTRVRERYVVVAPVSGRVARLSLAEGAHVRAGDVVARIAPPPLDSQAVIQTQARIDAVSALAMQAATGVRVATAELAQRRREHSCAQRLAEVGGIAPRVVVECALAQLQAEEALRAAQERLKAAEADVRQARAALVTQGAEATIVVRAPASGRVLRVPERSERIVAAGTPLMEIGDPASLEVVVDVLSSDGSLIRPGDVVRLGGWDDAGGEAGEVLQSRVRAIEPGGYTKTSALGVEEQRVNVVIDADRPPSFVGDGFRVEATIVVWSAPDVVIAPRSALFQEDAARDGAGGWRIFVVEDGTVVLRSVRIGHFGGASAEVLSGIEPGDEIVVFPSDRIRDGIRVTTRQ